MNGEVDRAAPIQGDKCAHFGSSMDAVPFSEIMECLDFALGENTRGLATANAVPGLSVAL